VALKLMLKDRTGTPQALNRFLNEARAAARIEGDHVARVLDVGLLENGAPFIALELLEGTDLARLLEQHGAAPPADVVDWILQALEALAQAHALGIVHRDLKPANLFLARRRDGTSIVKVLDFGISKQSAFTSTPLNVITETQAILGSPMYMAPEQLRNARTVDARTDVWSIGVVLYELIAGRPPFEGQTIGELFAAVLEQPAPPLRTWLPTIDPGLEAVVTRCLSRDVAQRYQNVSELADALAPFAPPGGRALADRIRRLLPPAAVAVGAAPALRTPGGGPPSPPPPPPPTQHVARTGSQWTHSEHSKIESRRTAPLAAAAAGGVLLVACGVVLTLRVVSTRHAAGAQSGLGAPSAATPPPSAALAPPDPAPEPPAAGPSADASAGPTVAPPRRPAVAPSPPPAQAPPHPPPPAAARAGCNPNYYMDAQGEKHFKPECFLPNGK
jgi:serine/threonine-protein kinase